MTQSPQFSAVTSYDLAALIASGQTTSQEIDLSGNTLCGFFFPAAFTGASLTLTTTTVSGGTYQTVQADELGSGNYTITATSGKYVPVTNLAIIAGLRFIKLVSASSEASARSITLVVRPV